MSMLRSVTPPATLRAFPGIRWLRIALRTTHLIAMGLLVGGVAVGASRSDLSAALWGTFLSGVLFVAVELYQSAMFLFQVKGVAVLVKLLLLVAAVELPESALPLIIAAIVIGGISSHMPGRYRHYSFLHGRTLQGPSG
jgi:hypothetical protein